MYVSLFFNFSGIYLPIYPTDYGSRVWFICLWGSIPSSSESRFSFLTCPPSHPLAQKYLVPHLRPPTSTAYEEDRDALTAQFDAAEALLKEIQSETAAVRQAVEEQKVKVDQTTQEVEGVVKEMREGEAKTRDEMREIREEINSIREMLPKVWLLSYPL